MKKIKVILFILIVLNVGLLIITNYSKTSKNNIVENQTKENGTINGYNGLAIMIEKDDNTYVAAQGDEWKTGYEFNSTLSKCENGGILTYNPDTHKITLKATGSDRCYVYFSIKKETLEEHIIAQVGVVDSNKFSKDVGYNNKGYSGELVHHDGTHKDTDGMTVLDAGDGGYRYSGDNPNNFVCFGPGAESYSRNESDATCDAKNLYRIIGIVPVETENGETQNLIKLIQSEYATTSQLGISSDGTPSTRLLYTSLKRVKDLPTDGFYWNDLSNTWSDNETIYNYWKADNGEKKQQKATLNQALNNETKGYLKYLNNSTNQQGIDWTCKIETVKWNIAGGNNDELYTVTAKTVYDNEKSEETGGRYQATQTTSIAKIGLMYVHDYGFASDKSNWKTNLNVYNTDTNRQKNWLFNGVFEWTISRHSDTGYSAPDVSGDGNTSNASVFDFAVGVRPVFYLKSDILFSGGNGTALTPYAIN